MVVTDLTQQKRNEAMRIEEEVLQKAHDKLEAQVAERTAELRTALSEIQAMKEQLEVENIYFRHESKRNDPHSRGNRHGKRVDRRRHPSPESPQGSAFVHGQLCRASGQFNRE